MKAFASYKHVYMWNSKHNEWQEYVKLQLHHICSLSAQKKSFACYDIVKQPKSFSLFTMWETFTVWVNKVFC